MQDLGFKNIVDNFRITCTFSQVASLEAGHIHDTYVIKTAEPGKTDYVLHKINQMVFSDVTGLMNNISKVTDRIHQKELQYPNLYGKLEILEDVSVISDQLSVCVCVCLK